MRVCDLIATYFKEIGMKRFFGFQGGAVTPLIDVMCQKGLSFHQGYHEQASGFSADAYARISERFSLVVATNGPGATNLVSSVANAYLDSIPVLFITGQVNTTDMKSKTIRQNGFQEVNTVEIMKPITKYAKVILNKQDILYELEKAIDIATKGRPGSVLLDIPLDILMSELDENHLSHYVPETEKKGVFDQKISAILQLMNQAKRPVILVGGGVHSTSARQQLKTLSEKTQIPVITTLMGFDVWTSNRYGTSGLYGHTYANLALLNADFILVLGSRMAKRQVGKVFQNYTRNAQIVHVDIDKSELDHSCQPDIAIQSDIASFLQNLLKYPLQKTNDTWLKKLAHWKKKYARETFVNGEEDPVLYTEIISQKVPNDSIICTDVGQNQMWVMQGWQLKEEQRLITSGGLGCMGFSLPAAIGAQLAEPTKMVIAFMGDGGLQMNLQELQTISRCQLPIKIVVFNNQSLGMIQENQYKYMGERYSGTKEGYSVPNLKKIASAFGIKYAEFKHGIRLNQILTDKNPTLIEIKLNSPLTRLLSRYDNNDIYTQEKI